MSRTRRGPRNPIGKCHCGARAVAVRKGVRYCGACDPVARVATAGPPAAHSTSFDTQLLLRGGST